MSRLGEVTYGDGRLVHVHRFFVERSLDTILRPHSGGARFSQSRPVLGKLIPVLAAAGTVALGMFLAMPSWRPTANPPQAVTGQVAPWLSDAQLFQETAAIGQSSEPRGARPIEALFQE